MNNNYIIAKHGVFFISQEILQTMSHFFILCRKDACTTPVVKFTISRATKKLEGIMTAILYARTQRDITLSSSQCTMGDRQSHRKRSNFKIHPFESLSAFDFIVSQMYIGPKYRFSKRSKVSVPFSSPRRRRRAINSALFEGEGEIKTLSD